MANISDCRKKEEHKMHMCALKADGFDTKNPAEFNAMTQNPQYECGNCGAKARNADNLCKPEKL